jgi:sulfatase modifying factor 1
VSKESCCTSPIVTGGTYFRMYKNDGSGPTEKANPATVSNFRLDKYEVTVGRFRQFVNAWNGGWKPLGGSGKHTHLNGGRGLVNVGVAATTRDIYESGWVEPDNNNIAPTNTNLACIGAIGIRDPSAVWTPAAGSNELLPMTCVNWYEAYAFCIWDGGFLPSEAEW